MTYTINDIEFEFDVFDIDNMERYEDALVGIKDLPAKLPKDGKESEKAKFICETIYDFFADVLGEELAGKILGDKMNIKTYSDVFGRFIDCTKKEQDESIASTQGILKNIQTASIPVNRQQRRSSAKR